MKAVLYTEYGSPDVLKVKEIEKPTPKENEVLIKVAATSVNYGDLLARNFKNVLPCKFNMPFLFWLMGRIDFGFTKPRKKILGSELSGEIESTGRNVKQFNNGDEVFAYLGQKMGAYTEYICIPENGCLTTKPSNMNLQESAVIPMGSIMALGLLKKVNVQAGQKILINGASGSIGSAAVQIAKSLGAEVAGVCGSPRIDYVKSLGVDKVIDYTKEDFTQSDEYYDIIFDVLGKTTFSKCKKSLKANGIYLRASFKIRDLLQMIKTSLSGGKKVVCALAPGSVEDLIAVKELIEKGKIKVEIDKRFTLDQTAEAHKYVESGKNTAKVVITMQGT